MQSPSGSGSGAKWGSIAVVLVGAAPAVWLAWTSPSAPLVLAAAGAGLAAGIAVAALVRGGRIARRSDAVALSLRSEVDALERRLREHAAALHEARTIDETTGVLRRPYFLARFEEALARDARLARAISLVLVKVPEFPEICQKHGRKAGDEVLRSVATAVSGATRGTDACGRLGEDVLAVVLTECSDPRPAVDRLLVGLDGLAVTGGSGRVATLIGSVLVEDPEEGWRVDDILREAEMALVAGRSAFEHRRLRRDSVRTLLG